MTTRVHNHPPYRPVCNERDVDGKLRGACLCDCGYPPDTFACRIRHIHLNTGAAKAAND